MRCLALAQSAKSRGWKVTFITACKLPGLQRRLRDSGFGIRNLQSPYPDPADLKLTLDFISRHRPTCVVIDGYHFDSAYQHAVKNSGSLLLVVDDYAHLGKYCCDVLLNQNINAERLNYDVPSTTRLLLGTRYALLREQFLSWIDYQRDIAPVARRILITLGGADLPNMTAMCIRAFQQLSIEGIEMKVVVGAASPQRDILDSLSAESKYPVGLYHDVRNMPELMAESDLAVSAGGSTCLELSFMGLPFIVTSLADNQTDAAEGYGTAGVALSLGWHSDIKIETLVARVSQLAESKEDRWRMSQKGRLLVDGKGAHRVIEIIEHTQPGHNMT